MDDEVTLLEKEYCPPLDSALFFAIVSDYDLSEATAIREARATLDALKESAEHEEDTVFDPSGSSGLDGRGSPQESPHRAQSWNGDVLSRTEDTDPTSVSQSMESLSIDGSSQSPPEVEGIVCGKDYDAGLEEISTEEKQALLMEMFPSMKAFDITYTLKKSRDNFGKTVEELLNHVFLEDEQGINGEGRTPTRGIDGFLDQHNLRGRKLKGKKRKQNPLTRRSSSTPAPLADSSPNIPVSKWDLAKRDVDFISQRTYLSAQTITSTYHKSGASLPSTILALCTSSSSPIDNPNISSPTDPILQSHAHELALDFPHLPQKHLTALIHLTHPSTASAHELALVLNRLTLPVTTTTTSTSQDIIHTNLIPQYTRPDLPPPEQPMPSTPKHHHTNTTPRPLTHTTLLTHSAAYTTARTAALSRASAAYRQSRSKPLMSGAASYYSQLGRDLSSSAAHYSALAADALVATQSSGSECDLHGVSVKDGVRIARDRVEAWWEGGGREWARAGKVQGGGGYRVVTGVGRHSEGGKGRLGPAVGGMLVREGWKVEVGEGVLVVRGRVRR
ncbi:hypothetical protein MMC24_001289 [Lignoscripta atroalba]|nr:hypothetical protein [Lignoscripta atroalba]